MWSHVILVSQTTVLLFESRLLLYSISLNSNIIYVLMLFNLYFKDIGLIMIVCVDVRMYVHIHLEASYYITVKLSLSRSI